MSHLRIAAALLLGSLAFLGGIESAQAKKADDVEPCVKFARSWAAAIEEAKLLNVPIVVHSHGFT